MGITNKDVLKTVAIDVPNLKTQMDSTTQQVLSLNTNKVDKVNGKGLSTNDYDTIEKSKVSTIINKADKSYVDTSIARMSSGTPLFATNVAGMTDTTKNYVNITDGFLYVYSNGAWTKTTVQYQSTGINDNTITVSMLKDKINKYPFTEECDLKSTNSGFDDVKYSKLIDSIIDINIINANENEKYFLRRMNVTSTLLHLGVCRVSDGLEVCGYYKEGFEQRSGVIEILMTQMNNSGISAKILLDTANLVNYSYFFNNYENSGIDKMTYIKDISMRNSRVYKYPFHENSELPFKIDVIKEIKLFNVENTNLYIERICRNFGTSKEYIIWISEISPFRRVAQYYATSIDEAQNKVLKLSSLNNSGVNGYIEIDWNLLPENYNNVDSSKKVLLDSKCCVDTPKQFSRFRHSFVNCLGDSFTAMGKYTVKLAELIGCNKLTNYGVGGTCVTSTGVADTNSFVSRVKSMDMTNVDLVTILGGINDFGTNKPLGDINSTDTTNFYGALKDIIETIYSKKIDTKIALLTPTRCGKLDFVGKTFDGYEPNDIGIKLDQYCQAIKDVGALYSIPVLDLLNTSGINKITIPTLTTDKLHPTDIQFERMAYQIFEFIKSV